MSGNYMNIYFVEDIERDLPEIKGGCMFAIAYFVFFRIWRRKNEFLYVCR